MSKPFFTVFTPLYNAKEKIHRVWESLNKQTFKDFEWIVIDDGSSDEGIDLIYNYKSLADFNVVIEQQSNQGKHIAWNRALDLANGYMFVPADADDRFISTTLEFFFNKWNNIPEVKRQHLSGLNVLCEDNIEREIVGDLYPKDAMISNLLELKYIHNVYGEKWGCIRVDLLKELPYPEITGRGNYIQDYTWFSLSKKFNIKCFNTVLRIYYIDASSITHSTNFLKKRIKESETRVHYLNWHFENNSSFLLKYNKKYLLKAIISYLNFWFYIDNKKDYTLFKLKPLYIRYCVFFLFLPVLVLHVFERIIKR